MSRAEHTSFITESEVSTLSLLHLHATGFHHALIKHTALYHNRCNSGVSLIHSKLFSLYEKKSQINS